jgi:hypothetical protein
MDLVEHPADSDVQKIKTKICKSRFSVHAFRPWIKWGAILGLVVGALFLAWNLSTTFRVGSRYIHGPEIAILGAAATCLGGGVVIGCFLSALIFGLIHFFRPVYVALFRDIAQFEREYGSTPERVRKSL